MKFGRKPAVHNRRTFRSGLILAKHLEALGPAPVHSNDYVSAVKVPWGMMGNDRLGDCVCADTGHSLMLRTANAGAIVVPTDQDVISLYSAVGGYNPADPSTDGGCDETAMCTYLRNTGFLGHKADNTGSIDPANSEHVKWCIQLFGSCRLGVNLPQSAMDTSKPWDVGGNETIVGGHDVPIFHYDEKYFYICTWGLIVPMTPAFLAKFVDEAHSELYFDWIESQNALSPSGLSLSNLAADLSTINDQVSLAGGAGWSFQKIGSNIDSLKAAVNAEAQVPPEIKARICARIGAVALQAGQTIYVESDGWYSDLAKPTEDDTVNITVTAIPAFN